MEQSNSTNDKAAEILKTLKIIHIAMLGGLGMFSTASFLIAPQVIWNLNATEDPFFLVVPAAILGGLVMSTLLFKQQLNGLMAKETRDEKIVGYQAVCIVKWALLEAPSTVGLVAFIITGNAYYFSLALLLILYFILQKPTLQKMQTELQLGG
jgi:hypothetical protein